jgi:ribosomal protein S6--L-glutamate ligase
MHFCFIIEEQYRSESMPRVVANQLLQWGHSVDVLEPHTMVTSLSDLASHGYDAYVLKTVSDGPGLSILDAAEAIGIPTINSSRSIHLVRNKAVAAAFAWAHGLPIPRTYFVAHPRLLTQIPVEQYPLVIKPSNGSSCRNVYRLAEPADLAAVEVELAKTNERFFLAQQYVENPGYDIKLYVTGKEIDAIAKKSPFHGEIHEGHIPLTPALRQLSLDVGRLFGLDIFGLDVVETLQGLALLDINDFPSFGRVPGASIRIADYILRTANRARLQRESILVRQYPHRSTLRKQSELHLRSS